MAQGLAFPPTPMSAIAPPSETPSGTAGTPTSAATGDHTHPRVTSADTFTFDANGQYTVVFTKTFVAKPSMVYSLVENSTSTGSVNFRTLVFNQDGNGLYVSASVYGSRMRALPAISGLSTGIVLILNLINAINAVFSALSGYSTEVPASGAQFSYVAVPKSGA